MEQEDSLYALADNLSGDMYLVHRDQVLGPLPPNVWRDSDLKLRRTIPREDIDSTGLSWKAASERLSEPHAWYVSRTSQEGDILVDRTEGFYAALRSFLTSGAARSFTFERRQTHPWAIPFVALFSDGRWRVGDDTLTQAVILPIWGNPGQITIGLQEDLEEELGRLQPWSRLQE